MSLPRPAARLAPTLLAALLLLGAPLRPAHAEEGYTLTDIVTATQRGVPREVVEEMARHPAQPWEIDHFLTLRLLRAGVSPDVVRLLSGGAHPTPAELTAASEAGEAWTPPAPEVAWETLLGRPLKLVLETGDAAEGTLLGVTRREVVLVDRDGDTSAWPREELRAVVPLGDVPDVRLSGVVLGDLPPVALDPATTAAPATDPAATTAAPAAATGPTSDAAPADPATDSASAAAAPGPLPDAPPRRSVVGLSASPPPAPLALGELRPAWDRSRATMTAGAGVAVAGAVVTGVLGPRLDEGTAPTLASVAVLGGVATLDLAALRQRGLLRQAGRPSSRVLGVVGLTSVGLGTVSWSISSAFEGRSSWNPAAVGLVGLGAAAGIAQGVQNQHVRERLSLAPVAAPPALALTVVDGTPALALTGAW